MTEQNQDALRCADALRQLDSAKKHHPSGPGGQMMGCESYRLIASGFSFYELQNSADHLDRLVAENEALREDLRKFREAASCERDLRQEQERHAAALMQQMLEALRNGGSVCASVSTSHDRRIRRDGCTLYAQTEEWCKWAGDEVGPEIIAAITAASEWLGQKGETK